jgi:hypothetical protein
MSGSFKLAKALPMLKQRTHLKSREKQKGKETHGTLTLPCLDKKCCIHH